MARALPATIGGVTVVDVTLGAGKTVTTLQGAWDWIYANYPDLVSANRIVRVLVTGTIDNTSATITIGGNITGDATRYVIFAADAGQGLCDQDPNSTPLRYDSSYAGFTSTTGVAIPALFAPSTASTPIHCEGLQFRYNSAGDGAAVLMHANIDYVSRSCAYARAPGFGAGGWLIRYGKSVRSYNDIFAAEDSAYVTTFVPETATTTAHVSEIHNATICSPASSNMSIGIAWETNSAAGSKCHNLLKLNGYDAEGIDSNWHCRGIAVTGGNTSGSGGYTGLVAADTVNAASAPIDLRLKPTAPYVRDGGYDNTADNPVDFFFRPRATSNFNIGAFDPDASSGGDTHNVSLTEAASATDASASVLVAAASIAETATAGDSRGSTQIATRGITEAATATASSSGAMVAGAGVSEAATASDAPGSTIVAGAGVSEVATAIDASGAATQAAAGVSEAATPVDAASAVLVAAASRAEPATAADQSTSAAILGAAVTEAAAAGDSSTGSIGAQTHDVAITEAASAGVAAAASAVLAASASEGGVAAEDAASTAVMAAAASEAASASESASAAIGASTYNVSATEVASAADSSVADVAIAAHASEGVSAADAAGANAVLVAQAAEAVAADDHASSTLHAVAVLVESVSAADAIVVSADFVRSIVEPAAATDWSEATIGAQTYNVSIVEAAHASDAAVIVAAFGARAPGWRGAVNAGAGRPAAIQTARRPASRG